MPKETRHSIASSVSYTVSDSISDIASDTVSENCYDQEYEREIKILKKKLHDTFALANQQATILRKWEVEMMDLKISSEELNKENDEVVNDMHDIMCENDEIKVAGAKLLEENVILKEKIVELEHELDILRDEAVSPHEMAETMEAIRSHMKYRFKEEATRRKTIESTIEEIRSEKDDLYEAIETMVHSRVDSQKEMDEIREELRKLENRHESIRLEKCASGERINANLGGGNKVSIQQDQEKTCVVKDVQKYDLKKIAEQRIVGLVARFRRPKISRIETLANNTNALFSMA